MVVRNVRNGVARARPASQARPSSLDPRPPCLVAAPGRTRSLAAFCSMRYGRASGRGSLLHIEIAADQINFNFSIATRHPIHSFSFSLSLSLPTMLRAARASASSRLVAASASASTSSSGAQRRLLIQTSCASSSSRSISSSARLFAQADQQRSQASSSSKGGSSKWYHRIKKQASNVLGLSSQQQQASVAAPMTEPKQESNSSAGSSQPQPLTEARQLEKAASARDDGHFAAALRSTAGTIRERQRLAKQRRQRQHRQNKGERKQAALGGKDEAAATGQHGATETKAEPTQPAASTSAQPKEEKGSSSQAEAKSSSQSSPSSSSSQSPPPPPPRAQGTGTGRVKRKNHPGRKERDYKAVREAAAAKGEKLTKKQVKALAESLRQQRVAEARAKEREAEAASSGSQEGPSGKQKQQQDQPQKSAPSTPRQWAKAKAKEPEQDAKHEAATSSSTSAPAAAESDPPEAATSSPTRTYRKRPPHLGVAPAPRTRLVEGDEAEQLRNISSSLYTPEEDWEQLDPSDRALNGSSSSPDSIPLRKGGILRADAIPVNGIDGLREMKVATLAHGLDRVLFNPGVHQLRDPRSGIYNYPPHLRQIPDVDLFDYGALPAYVTSSADMELIEIAQKQGARFCGSTSSLTSIFSHCYFLLSGWKAPEVKDFSHEFRGDAVPKGFSFAAKLPATINFTPKTTPGDSRAVYAIDSNSTESGSDENSNYVLLQLGKAMEKMLTVDREEFDSFLRVNRPDANEEEESSSSPAATAEPEKEAYYYSRAGNHFVMRSQLDCHDSRLPRKTFDLKSRACVSIRYDRANWVEASGYQIKHLNGLWESFERERYDMTRSAFLKYYFQGRIGNMDGIFVAYHNAARFFGFEVSKGSAAQETKNRTADSLFWLTHSAVLPARGDGQVALWYRGDG